MGKTIKSHVHTFPPYEFHKASMVNRHLNTLKMWYNLNGNSLTYTEYIKVMVIGLINAVIHCYCYCHFCVNFNGFKRLYTLVAKLHRRLNSVFKYFHFRKLSLNQAPSLDAILQWEEEECFSISSDIAVTQKTVRIYIFINRHISTKENVQQFSLLFKSRN